MRKSDKKTDNAIRLSLTQVCELALKDIPGFRWLTHTVNYDHFPQSLCVICVFDTDEHLQEYLRSDNKQTLQSSIARALNDIGVSLKNPKKHILFDTEEDCNRQHQGNWRKRLTSM
ncbi:Fis family transcriptional regulator [Alteromonas sediminis]|uniref:Fis family transcriptional regulator n=1 Tax=Alteromonas sediminis TaxID=2259342 RepID=A0A3N5Y6H4_9ALTE|nr:Fis family transcriptional regulator [Alteromonas sediminis]RPJ66089.1 Fis family transcriptional regulator [Alteromonas sediminis]